jgi:transposase-like protein
MRLSLAPNRAICTRRHGRVVSLAQAARIKPDKTAVMGILERGGKVITKVVENTKKKTLQPAIREHVLAGSTVFTDALKSYEGLMSFNMKSSTTRLNTCAAKSTPTGLRVFGRSSSAGLTEPTFRLSRLTCSITLTNKHTASTIGRRTMASV